MTILDAVALPGPLFVVGSCKNAGKTTLLNFLNAELFSRAPRETVGLATIGRDGEPEDAVWRHPKPPIHLWPGNLVVTVQAQLDRLGDTVERLETLPFKTALGQVVLGRARREGRIEIVGPDTNAQLWQAIERLAHHGSRVQLIDGAFDRRTQIASADGSRFALVVSADAAPTPEKAAAWLAFQIALFDLPPAAADFAPPPLPLGLHWRHGKDWNDRPDGAKAATCVGPLTPLLFAQHLEHWRDVDVVVDDATKIFLDAHDWMRLTRRCRRVAVRRTLRLILVAANPRGLLREFEPAAFFETLAAACPRRTIIDVVAGLARAGTA